ncbi:hypothetical protein COX67_00685 [Candidatus Falkowbacteria bacterium CG_4_10_14_0_2_um_filter_36_22]|uniref:Uncharacterized protein n=1 Tax=Candidatus Falkowbacteria bacterium CG02_land_8_20_14_3_00_36_14 TaxID=1974560 RepID=A0A2M7DMA3_9BACT|nr:MAG: hypothetical protein COS18_03745 [Candidatus Falkowbacteria bacterium CG02_land_8_20_14_3_00_36_14]PJA11272.1 MAG: hypothetical protein COX67_00685 [Candidatus Falkowbacteria bacterium CG_4_10_14_0_2_um_filter_36_22]
MANGKEIVLKDGVRFVLPSGAYIEKSHKRNRRRFPETPILIRVFHGRNGFYDILDKRPPRGSSKVIFMPKEPRSGEEFEICWVENNCACAKRIDS